MEGILSSIDENNNYFKSNLCNLETQKEFKLLSYAHQLLIRNVSITIGHKLTPAELSIVLIYVLVSNDTLVLMISNNKAINCQVR